MPETRFAKPVIKLYLLPAWNETQFQTCSNRLVNAVRSVPALHVAGEDDVIILFSQDAMVYGLGGNILIEMNLPQDLLVDDTVAQAAADALFAVMQGLLPNAYVQCTVSSFDTGRGYRATVRNDG